ncbi:hypothetical protein [Pseudorhodoferax soli]|uniref:Uncharacterized protein n=1 Tax=Pseudorhodoferax soli TaxID=545864 RepID=A0A368XDT2_9BURK|nr:hypothetical protein [Pseudorhodoferax soli]RCW65188.1 hypothetical protein DES41_113112 [Pseudorhodoferax soli]
MATRIVAPGGAPTHPQSVGQVLSTPAAGPTPEERLLLSTEAIEYIDLLGWISDAQIALMGLRLVADTTPSVAEALRTNAVPYRSPDLLDGGMSRAVGHVRERLIHIVGELGGAA